MDEEDKGTYVSQLKEVFDSCDTTGDGSLNEEELRILCEKLHLVEHSDILIQHLLENETEVKFDDFKECFVAVLTQAIPSSEDASEIENGEDMNDREISPKFTLGRKKYGRRSRPASIADDDSSVASPDLSRQSSVEKSFSGEMRVKGAGAEGTPGKRPMSPSASQQPPTKSGRMTDEKIPSLPDGSPSHPVSDSDTDPNQSFDNNPVQYLQETWKKLNIGQNGYLNVEELALVCEHIGMDMTEEVVAQLFEKLDCDQDGQISFDEFLQGLFQHGDPQICDSPQRKTDSSKSLFNEGSRDDHQITNSCVSGIFSCVDPNNTGYADASAILELWESLELPCAPQILEELGFNTNLKINLSDLSSVLEDVLCNVFNRPILQLAFGTYQNDLQYLRQTLDQVLRERNKLRVNVEEANSRAALLAQEVDDNHAKLESSLHKKLLLMEKKYQEQARELVEELQEERESLNTQANKLRQQLKIEMDSVREEEIKLKARLNALEQENKRLEQDLHENLEKCIEAEKLNDVLQKELCIVPDLKSRLADLEAHMNEVKEKNHMDLLQELEKLKSSNQELQDKIDELTLEIENMRQNSTSDLLLSTREVNRTHSWLSDYKKACVTGSKRRGSESSSEDHSDEESPTVGKMRKTFFSNGNAARDIDSPASLTDVKKTINIIGNQPSMIDILVKDMMQDQARLLRKLQIAEESQMKMEKMYIQSENKNKILSGLVHTLSAGTVKA